MLKFVVPTFVNAINVGDASGTKRLYYILCIKIKHANLCKEKSGHK